jgi:nucleoside phosphorylase
MTRILLVEDNQHKIEQIAAAIQASAVQVDLRIAMNVQDAKRALLQGRFDLLILDIHLPKRPEGPPEAQGGLTLLRWLRGNGQSSRPQYIIGTTAFEESFQLAQSEFGNLIWQVIPISLSSNAWRGQLIQSILDIQAQIRPPYMGDGVTHRVDVLVVTALQEPELSAVLDLNTSFERIEVSHDASLYFKGQIVAEKGSASVVAVAASDKGLAGAAIAATKGIYTFWPRFVYMTGITAGVRRRTKIGDVVFGDPCWDWGSGKIKEAQQHDKFSPAPYQRRLDESLVRNAIELKEKRELLTKIWEGFPAKKPKEPPRIHIGAMASGASVLQSSEAVKSVIRQQKDVLAIEMEAFSIMFACQAAPSPRPHAIIAKSVCDFGDGKKNDWYQPYAAYTSAKIFEAFVADFVVKDREP